MRRFAWMAALISLLAACGGQPTRAPESDSRTPPNLAGRFFPPEGWAWGYVKSGLDQPQRYGVAAARGVVPRAVILVVVGSGETAEAWFETVADLNAKGATVWVLERAGQAGSGRYAEPRDLMHAASLDPDVASVRAMVRAIIRPDGSAPVFLLAHDDGAVVALRAVEAGLPVDGLILSSPRFAPGQPETSVERLDRRLGRGTRRASGWRAWSREAPDAFARGLTHDHWRGAVQQAWQLANPDLRMSGDSIAWRQALREAAPIARRDAASVRTPTLILVGRTPNPEARELCVAMPDCRIKTIAGARPLLHLESDAYRRPWLQTLEEFAGLR